MAIVSRTGRLAEWKAPAAKSSRRIGGRGHTFSSSPLAVDGRIYAVTENGLTVVFSAGDDDSTEVAKNALDEMSLATPAVDRSGLFIRTQTKLYRVESR